MVTRGLFGVVVIGLGFCVLKDKVKLTSRGIDVRALKAGQNVEFDLNMEDEDNFNWEDEEDYKLDYEKIYRYRNMDMVMAGEEDEVDDKDEGAENLKLPFEKLRLKMFDITSDKTRGVLKRVLQPGVGGVIPNGSLVRSEPGRFELFDHSKGSYLNGHSSFSPLQRLLRDERRALRLHSHPLQDV